MKIKVKKKSENGNKKPFPKEIIQLQGFLTSFFSEIQVNYCQSKS